MLNKRAFINMIKLQDAPSKITNQLNRNEQFVCFGTFTENCLLKNMILSLALTLSGLFNIENLCSCRYLDIYNS